MDSSDAGCLCVYCSQQRVCNAVRFSVFMHQDLTPKQRVARKQLLQEMRERVAKGEGDLMIFNGKIVKRRPRPGSS